MTVRISTKKQFISSFMRKLTPILLIGFLSGSVSARDHDFFFFIPGNLVVSRSVYDNNPNNVKVGQTLPPNCASTTGGCSPGAINNGTYPQVWNNDLSDGSFGITSKIFLDQVTPFGFRINSLEVPNSSERDVRSTSRSAGYQLQLEIRACPQSLAGPSISDLHGICCTDRCARCFQFQHARGRRSDQSSRRECFPRRGAGRSRGPIQIHGHQRLQR